MTGWEDRVWPGQGDKIQHAEAGLVAGYLSAFIWKEMGKDFRSEHPVVSRALIYLPVVCMAAGKEAWDYANPDHHDCDWRDAAATIVGGTVGIELTLRW
jgi:hypothetical protein